MKKPENHEKHIPSDGKSQALAISISMLLLLAISAISLSFWNSSESSHDSVAINLAGRQRMLTQRIEKDLLRLEYAKQNRLDTKLILQDLLHSYFLFDQTLTMLGQGNLVTQAGTTITITSTKSSKATELIAQANAIWAPMRAALLHVISSSVRPPAPPCSKPCSSSCATISASC